MICRLSITALCALALAACGESDIPEPAVEHGGPIALSGYVAGGSRATVSSTEFTKAGSAFKVWATMHSVEGGSDVAKVFDATTVTSDGKDWSYDGDVQYWFPLQTYNFRAIWPADVEGVNFDVSNGERATLTVKDFDVRSGQDLLFASDRREIGVARDPDDKEDVEPAVALKFQHLLSRISFRGRSDESYLGKGRRVIVTSAAIYGVAATGTWSGYEGVGEWTPGAPTGTAEEPLYKVEFPDGLELSPQGTDIFTGDDVILAIPQVLTTEAKMVIECHYNVADAHTFTFEAAFATESFQQQWGIGASLRYPFTVASGVFFSTPDVVDWVEMPVDSPDFKIE